MPITVTKKALDQSDGQRFRRDGRERQRALQGERRWQVFRGESTDSKDALFSVKKSRLLQFKTELDVNRLPIQMKMRVILRSKGVIMRGHAQSILEIQIASLPNTTREKSRLYMTVMTREKFGLCQAQPEASKLDPNLVTRSAQCQA
ncbi:hypothetical protein Cni_G18923 [Canna indica]|uniref:Uncharacterized protein n=1 Tax=Canna indica TaxID=4628 RepID=A0AAQ3QGI1_9LILI|nr:hypothetical protein Cni_G18923 [Canna indica]